MCPEKSPDLEKMEKRYICPFLYLKSPTTSLSICVSVCSASDRDPEGQASHHVPGTQVSSSCPQVCVDGWWGHRRKGLHLCTSEGMGPGSLGTACVSLSTGRFPYFLEADTVTWNQAVWLQRGSLPAVFVSVPGTQLPPWGGYFHPPHVPASAGFFLSTHRSCTSLQEVRFQPPL